MNKRYLSYFILLLCLILPPSDSVITGERVRRLSNPTIENTTNIFARFVVSIRTRTPRKYYGDNHFCGGVIVSLRFAMTCAHCLIDSHRLLLSSRDLLVVAGSPNRLKFFRDRNVHAPVTTIFVPENFTIYNTNDLALLKLTYPLPMNNKYLAVIKLPTAEPIKGNEYMVLGWGRLYHNGPLASDITQIKVTLYSHLACELILNVFTDEMMCAGNMDHMDMNPCAGDLGGPLIDNDTVYGIVSYRLGCGHKELPSVYTNVYENKQWINLIIATNCSHRPCNYFALFLFVFAFKFACRK